MFYGRNLVECNAGNRNKNKNKIPEFFKTVAFYRIAGLKMEYESETLYQGHSGSPEHCQSVLSLPRHPPTSPPPSRHVLSLLSRVVQGTLALFHKQPDPNTEICHG